MDANDQLLSTEFLTYLYHEMGRKQDEAGFSFWQNAIENDGSAKMLSAYTAAATSTDNQDKGDAEFLAGRLELELGVLRAAHEQNMTLTTEQLQTLKSKLLENRTGVLNGSLTVEMLMIDL